MSNPLDYDGPSTADINRILANYDQGGDDHGMRLIEQAQQEQQAARDEAWRRNWFGQAMVGNKGRAALNKFLEDPQAQVLGAVVPGRSPLAAPALSRLPARPAGPIFSYKGFAEPVPGVEQMPIPRYLPRKLPEHLEELFGDEGVRAAMKQGINHGVAEYRGHEWWGGYPEARKLWEDALGSSGQDALNRFLHFQGAASPGSPVDQMVTQGSYYYTRDMQGKGLPSYNPAPYGPKMATSHRALAKWLMDHDYSWDATPAELAAKPDLAWRAPKARTMPENFMGNLEPGTMDRHALRAPIGHWLNQIKYRRDFDPRLLNTDVADPGGGTIYPRALFEAGDLSLDALRARPALWLDAPKRYYGAFENYYRGLGQDMGLPTAGAQAAGWVGHGRMTGLKSPSDEPYWGAFERRVLETARKRDEPWRKTLNNLILGRKALLGLGAGAVLAPGIVGSSHHDDVLQEYAGGGYVHNPEESPPPQRRPKGSYAPGGLVPMGPARPEDDPDYMGDDQRGWIDRAIPPVSNEMTWPGHRDVLPPAPDIRGWVVDPKTRKISPEVPLDLLLDVPREPRPI